MPEEFLNRLKTNIKKEWKTAFLSAVIIGFFAHMYVFTNTLPNHDGLINIYHSQLKFGLGRFFLGPFSGISSFFALPWIIGTLSVIYLALMAVVITEIFDLHKIPAIVLSSGIVVTFPTIASTFSYMFTADAYMAGFLLAVLAILITKKYKYGFLPASLILYVSVGIYQANLAIVLTVVTVWLIVELAFNRTKMKPIFLTLLKYVSMTALGMIFYVITFKTYQSFFGGKIVEYQGLNQAGLHPSLIREQLQLIYNSSMDFFFRGLISDSPVNLHEVLNVLLFVLIGLSIIIGVVINQIYKSPIRLGLICVSLILLPVFAYFLYFSSPGISYHMLMVMALVPVYLLPIVMYDRLEPHNILVKWFSWVTVCILFLIVFNFAIISNIAYFNMDLKYERSYALVNRILDRIEQTEGYENASKIAVIGRPMLKSMVTSKPVREKIPNMTGTLDETFLVQPYHFEYMLSNFFGKSLTRVGDEELKIIRESGILSKMTTWPSKGSIRIENQIIIIKFS